MAFLKATANTNGVMAVHTKGISSKVFEVDMEVGEVISREVRAIKATTLQIRNKVMEFTLGITDGHTKAIFRTT